MAIRKRNKHNRVTRGDSRRREARDASHIGRRGKSTEGTALKEGEEVKEFQSARVLEDRKINIGKRGWASRMCIG